MATIRNERDIQLQATTPRLLSIDSNYVTVIPSTTIFSTGATGVIPSSITVLATFTGVLRGTVVWSSSPSISMGVSGNTVTINGSSVPVGTSVTITATLSFLGVNYQSSTTITHAPVTPIYKIISTANTITNNGGVFTPTSVQFLSRSIVSGEIAVYNGRFIISTSTNGVSYSTLHTSGSDVSSYTYSPNVAHKFIRVRLYKSGGTTVLLDETTIAISTESETDLSNVLLKNTANILTGTIVPENTGALRVGGITWNSTTGALTGGTGIAITEWGLIGANAGVPKFTIESSTGNATFGGTLNAASGTFVGSLTAASGTFVGSLGAGATVDPAATVSGNPFSTITSNASNGATAFSDTVDFRVPGAPTNSPTIDAITASSAAVGTVDIRLTWTYTQGAIKADHFILYVLEGTTNPTTSSPVLATVTGDSRDLRVSGVPMDKSYKVGIVAARNSALGVQKTTIVNAWTRTGATANITANIDGTAPSGVKNSGITLSSSGALIGAGGGSITALDYSNVSGTKPPANATSNIFTTSTSNPSGGTDGAAHWNSATSTMWFRTAGVWRVGGTINAGEITVGTLAAARIAANSITSDKINVSTLSAITANLGTVDAGSITGTAGIDITGTAKFKGATTSSSYNSAVHANESASATNGIYTRSGSASGYALVATGTANSSSGILAQAAGAGRAAIQANGVSSALGLSVTGGVSVLSGSTSVGVLSCSTFSTSSSSVVTNLNADTVDGFHANSMLRTIFASSGSCNVAGSGSLNFTSTVSGTTTTASGNTFTVAPTSDRKLKKDIEAEELGLDFINKLIPVTYRWRDKSNDKIKYHGFIYQDVAEIEEFDEHDALCRVLENGDGSVDYVALIAPMVNAIKELTQKIKGLENERKNNTKRNS